MERNCLGRKNQVDLAKSLEEVGSKKAIKDDIHIFG